jgi:nucleoside-diphosphate-sugar epimerase
MNVIIFGASGMVGEGVLLECLDSVKVDSVTTVVRRETGREHEKLSEVIVDDPGILSSVEIDLGHLDACFWCVGISSVGLSEDDYARITYGLTVSAMETLLQLNPAMKFVFVSAVGADSTETSSTMCQHISSPCEAFGHGRGFTESPMLWQCRCIH